MGFLERLPFSIIAGDFEEGAWFDTAANTLQLTVKETGNKVTLKIKEAIKSIEEVSNTGADSGGVFLAPIFFGGASETLFQVSLWDGRKFMAKATSKLFALLKATSLWVGGPEKDRFSDVIRCIRCQGTEFEYDSYFQENICKACGYAIKQKK